MKFAIEIEKRGGKTKICLNKVIAGKTFIIEEENLVTYEITKDQGSGAFDDALDDVLEQVSERISNNFLGNRE